MRFKGAGSWKSLTSLLHKILAYAIYIIWLFVNMGIMNGRDRDAEIANVYMNNS